MNMNELKEYIEQVITELSRDHKFIKQLKAARVHKDFSIANVERLVEEWATSHAKLKLSASDVRIAQRLAYERFPEIHDKHRGDIPSAKKSLFIMLSSFFKNRQITK